LTTKILRLLRLIHRRAGRPAEGPIFTNGRGRPWTVGGFACRFRRLVRAAGITRHISPYSLRHAFTVAGLEAGVGERQLADVLGHSTSKYIAWYGRGVRARSGYLRGIADQVRGRPAKGGAA
jgi:integrase/recombinase XerD